MAIEFPLPRVLAEAFDAARTELNRILDELSLRLRVEDFRTVGAYASGWSDGSPGVKFYKGPDKRVQIRGFAQKVGPTLPETIFTLPVGYRPSETVKFWIGTQEIEVQTGGNVLLNSDPGYASPPGANLTGVDFLGER